MYQRVRVELNLVAVSFSHVIVAEQVQINRRFG